MSKRLVSSACAAAVLSFAVAMAQTTGTRVPTDRANRADTKPVSILGCVARGTAANQAGQFVLNNASMSTAATGQVGIGQVGPAGSVGAGGIEAVGTLPGGVTGATSTDHPRTLEPAPVGTSGREPEGQIGQGGKAGQNRPVDAHETSGTATSYVLIPGRTNLSMWVGQRVEVTGTIGSAPSAGSMPRLQVVSVRPVQGNCL